MAPGDEVRAVPRGAGKGAEVAAAGSLRARRFTGIATEDEGMDPDDVRIDAVVMAGPHRERPGLLFTLRRPWPSVVVPA